jgi:hypothetical protein
MRLHALLAPVEHRHRRSRRRPLAHLTAALALATLACASPDRGWWRGTFDGTVSGTVEFEISTRGTKLRGSMTGSTRDGQPFEGDLRGQLDRGRIEATFEGRSRTGMGLPIKFDGALVGTLADGVGGGTWNARVTMPQMIMDGSWSVEQRAPPNVPARSARFLAHSPAKCSRGSTSSRGGAEAREGEAR